MPMSIEPFWHVNILKTIEPFWHANVLQCIELFWHANVLWSIEPFWHAGNTLACQNGPIVFNTLACQNGSIDISCSLGECHMGVIGTVVAYCPRRLQESPGYSQGLIEPPKAVRGHATHRDSEIQHVTKFKFT